MKQIRIHRPTVLSRNYELRPLEALRLDGARTADIGWVRIGQGMRSPPEGFRSGAKHELGYVLSGSVRIDTHDGSHIADVGDVVVLSPAVPHATSALADTVIFYVVIDPIELPTAIE